MRIIANDDDRAASMMAVFGYVMVRGRPVDSYGAPLKMPSKRRYRRYLQRHGGALHASRAAAYGGMPCGRWRRRAAFAALSF